MSLLFWPNRVSVGHLYRIADAVKMCISLFKIRFWVRKNISKFA